MVSWINTSTSAPTCLHASNLLLATSTAMTLLFAHFSHHNHMKYPDHLPLQLLRLYLAVHLYGCMSDYFEWCGNSVTYTARSLQDFSSNRVLRVFLRKFSAGSFIVLCVGPINLSANTTSPKIFTSCLSYYCCAFVNLQSNRNKPFPRRHQP